MKRMIMAVMAVLLMIGGLALAVPAMGTSPESCEDKFLTEVIQHEALTKTIHHPGVDAVSGAWWNWSPNDTQGPQDYEPAFPEDERGTWQGPHLNGGPEQDTYGTFNVSNGNSGNSSWFHRETGTAAVEAWDEVVIIKGAYEETVKVANPEYPCVVEEPTEPTEPSDPVDPAPAPEEPEVKQPAPDMRSETFCSGNALMKRTEKSVDGEWINVSLSTLNGHQRCAAEPGDPAVIEEGL